MRHLYHFIVAALASTRAIGAFIPPTRPIWSYVGCFADSVQSRILDDSFFFSNDNTTVGNCLSFCDENGYILAGLEHSTHCFCGSILRETSSMTSQNTCSMTCSGNATETCGGVDRLSVYSLGNIDLENPTATNNLELRSNIAPSPTPSNIETTSKPRAVPRPRPVELVSNGDFADHSNWTETSNPHGYSSVHMDGTYLSQDRDTAYGITARAYRASARSMCISQQISFPRAGFWNFTSRIGRSNSDDRASAPDSQLDYELFMDKNQVHTGDVCDPALGRCTYSDPFGSYVDVAARIQISARDLGTHNISICAVYTTQSSSDSLDRFLIKHVSVFGPGKHG